MSWFEVSFATSFQRSDLLQAVLLEEGAGGSSLMTLVSCRLSRAESWRLTSCCPVWFCLQTGG